MGVATVALKMGKHGLRVDNRRRQFTESHGGASLQACKREGGSHDGIEMIQVYEWRSESSYM